MAELADRELVQRLLHLAQMAVDQALDLNYDDPEDYHIYRELMELRPAAKSFIASHEEATACSNTHERGYRTEALLLNEEADR